MLHTRSLLRLCGALHCKIPLSSKIHSCTQNVLCFTNRKWWINIKEMMSNVIWWLLMKQWIITSGLAFTDAGHLSHVQDSWSAGVTGAELHQADVLLVNQPFVNIETENRDTDAEENIVYLWNGWCWNETFGLGFSIWDLGRIWSHSLLLASFFKL